MQLVGDTNGLPTSVTFSTNPGTAQGNSHTIPYSNVLTCCLGGGVDYDSVTEVIQFPPTTVLNIICPQVRIVDDTIPEPSETFTVSLSNPVGCTLENPFTATVTINGKATVRFGY